MQTPARKNKPDAAALPGSEEWIARACILTGRSVGEIYDLSIPAIKILMDEADQIDRERQARMGESVLAAIGGAFAKKGDPKFGQWQKSKYNRKK